MKKKVFSVILVLFIAFFFVEGVNAVKYDNYSNELVSCGGNLMVDIPQALPRIISIVYTIIQIAVPIVLVVTGSIDLFKGLTQQKEEEMKKGQQILIKRFIVATIIFFMFMIVRFLISLVADNDGARIIKCAECFVENKCDK